MKASLLFVLLLAISTVCYAECTDGEKALQTKLKSAADSIKNNPEKDACLKYKAIFSASTNLQQFLMSCEQADPTGEHILKLQSTVESSIVGIRARCGDAEQFVSANKGLIFEQSALLDIIINSQTDKYQQNIESIKDNFYNKIDDMSDNIDLKKDNNIDSQQ